MTTEGLSCDNCAHWQPESPLVDDDSGYGVCIAADGLVGMGGVASCIDAAKAGIGAVPCGFGDAGFWIRTAPNHFCSDWMRAA